MVKYDGKYVIDKHHYRDKKCSHDDTVIYDGRFYKDSAKPKAFQNVCTRCGLLSKWATLDDKSRWSVKFPKVKK